MGWDYFIYCIKQNKRSWFWLLHEIVLNERNKLLNRELTRDFTHWFECSYCVKKKKFKKRVKTVKLLNLCRPTPGVFVENQDQFSCIDCPIAMKYFDRQFCFDQQKVKKEILEPTTIQKKKKKYKYLAKINISQEKRSLKVWK